MNMNIKLIRDEHENLTNTRKYLFADIDNNLTSETEMIDSDNGVYRKALFSKLY